MDPFSKKLLKELEEMQQQTGRMLRNMSLGRMMPMESGNWKPPVDIYEAEQEIYVYFDLAGVDGDSLNVLVDEHQLLVNGRRQLPGHESIACIHQLEIELGNFERTVSLPSVVDANHVLSAYSNGILVVTLPKRQQKGKVNIKITPGVE